MRVRKRVNNLTEEEKQKFINAILRLKEYGGYDQYVRWHHHAMMTMAVLPGEPASSDYRNVAHRGPAFLPWHREFLRRFELDARSVLQWYEIDVPSRTVVQQNGFGASGRHYFYPVVQTDINRNAYLTFGRSAADEYAQLRQTGRLVGDPPGQLQGSALIAAGQAAYTRGRWGDYFGIGRDPSDARTVWSYGEYAGTGNTWRTRVSSARF